MEHIVERRFPQDFEADFGSGDLGPIAKVRGFFDDLAGVVPPGFVEIGSK